MFRQNLIRQLPRNFENFIIVFFSGQPFTGRMHQIRVHLQWLGYPIIDDPIYNHKAWGQDRGKGGVEEDKAWKVCEEIIWTLCVMTMSKG
jgi:23S rRNA-/tRNA-specific pseudouridylate synthase